MKYIKAKYTERGRGYTFCTEDDVKAGDTVVAANGSKLMVSDESVDMAWVETYGAEKVAIVKKYEDSEDK